VGVGGGAGAEPTVTVNRTGFVTSSSGMQTFFPATVVQWSLRW
jgi:hypothetical protein